jgi:hypothetical protein
MIEHWLKQLGDYHIYNKNIKPGLTPENKVKQVIFFSTQVHNLWGPPRSTGRKILWAMCDEKGFHALVPRTTNAKACAELGLHKSTYSAHHKSHIGKVMIHCTVGYLFLISSFVVFYSLVHMCMSTPSKPFVSIPIHIVFTS